MILHPSLDTAVGRRRTRRVRRDDYTVAYHALTSRTFGSYSSPRQISAVGFFETNDRVPFQGDDRVE